MTAESHITDPLLHSVLNAADLARQQGLLILDLISDFHASDTPTTSSDDDAALQISKQQKTLNTHLASLRTLNRRAVLGVRSTKTETAEARQEVDSLHLELQNLYYEQRHLRGEIAACQDYAHTYERISMVDVETFLGLHPELVGANEDELTVARIREEHAQRVALEEQKQELIRKKEALMKSTGAKKEELGKLDAEMEKWANGQLPVRKIFEAREKALAA